MTIDLQTAQQDALNLNFMYAAAILQFVHGRDEVGIHTAALIITRAEDILMPSPLERVPITVQGKRTRPLSDDLVMQNILNRAHSQDVGDEWCQRLVQFINIAPVLSRPQQYNVLTMVLNDQVNQTGKTTFEVQGSKLYTVSLTDGETIDHGFECSCRGYWSHGGGKYGGEVLCKHVAAATIVACDNQPVDLDA